MAFEIGRPDTAIEIYNDKATVKIVVSSFVIDANALLQVAEIIKAALEWSEELAECRMQEPAKEEDDE